MSEEATTKVNLEQLHKIIDTKANAHVIDIMNTIPSDESNAIYLTNYVMFSEMLKAGAKLAASNYFASLSRKQQEAEGDKTDV